MNDRFTFRAWCKNVSTTFNPDDKKPVMSDPFDFQDFDGDYFIPFGCYLSDMEIMQDTGLKDKMGKAIFEGDILKDGGLNFVVEWNDRNGCFARKGLSEFYFGQTANICEVIGNIWENPELLPLNKN